MRARTPALQSSGNVMNEHITETLDNMPLASLSAVELETIRVHVETCAGCRRAYAAAQLSALLITERVAEAEQHALNANPFFQTRVLAAWREQQAAGSWSLSRLWKATGALVASMAATTAALAALTFFVPSSDIANQQTAVVPYSAETVVFEQDQNDGQITNDQVINAIYENDDEGK